MRVTDIRVSAKGTAEVYIDGEAAAILDASLLGSMPVKKGEEIEDTAYRDLLKIAAYYNARESALRSLDRADFSERGLCRRLREKGVTAEVAEAVAAEMAEKGYLNDRRYAERYARYYGVEKAFGSRRVREELRQRGIGDEMISEVIAEICPEDTENARRYAEKNRLAAPRDGKEKKKFSDKLLRAGYGYEAARRALEADDD